VGITTQGCRKRKGAAGCGRCIGIDEAAPRPVRKIWIIKTYLDANVLIVISRGKLDSARRLMAILDDPDRRFIVSSYLVLETIPKPLFHGKDAEVKFMREFIARAYRHIPGSQSLVDEAVQLAGRYDIHPLDALHIAAAIAGKADEFLTLEKPDNPICRPKEIRVVSLYEKMD
jgi:predicted nucleic acid-binding protein